MSQQRTVQQSLRRIAKSQRHLGAKYFDKIGLSSGQPKVIQFLYRYEGCSQKELAKLCHIQPATMTSLLNHLEKDELIYRQVNKEDRRITNVYLTPQGKELQKQVHQILTQMDKEALKDFSEAEKKQLNNFLDRIYQNLNVEELNEDV